MRAENCKYPGFFWSPSEPDNKFSGTLEVFNGGKVELNIIGECTSEDSLMASYIEDHFIGRLVGHVESLGPVTLENCHYKSTFPSSMNGVATRLIKIDYFLSGILYEADESIKFDSFNFSIDGLEKWVNISGISSNYQINHIAGKLEEVNVKFIPPERLRFEIDNNISLEIFFGYLTPEANNLYDINLSQSTHFKISSRDSLTIQDVISYLYKFINLLNFAIDTRVSLKKVYCFSSNINDEQSLDNKQLPIELLYQSRPFYKETPDINSDRMLFKFSDIRNSFSNIAKNWLEAYEIVTPSLNLYAATKGEAYQYVDGKFLAMSQALESFHRRTCSETIFDKYEFKNLVESLTDSCTSKHKKWLEQKLNYANELGLRQRLKHLFTPYNSYISNSKVLINSIINTRNYYTHFDESLKQNTAQGADLVKLYLLMEAVLQLSILQYLGFSMQEIESIISSNLELRNKLTSTIEFT